MLRDPVDRAISKFYFTKMGDKPWYSHPNLAEVQGNELVGFYRNPVHQNLQTRFVAGLVSEWIGRYISFNGPIGTLILKQAKQNLLKTYEAYGLKERFEESAALFANRIGAQPVVSEKRRKKTRDRPAKEELSRGTIRDLRTLNSLDVKLYDFAVQRFKSQKE